VRQIEKTLFEFIWKYSKRDQLVLLVFTVALFPFLFLTLELPKRIINDAIGAQSAQIDVFGVSFGQVPFLGLLCVLFLASVLVHGLLKMRINTMTGVLSERMLRRLRYGLISRMLRFPKPYFQRTSQGEIVAMVTGETEPMGGLMGTALTQPVLQAGQMLTILFFLFLQSFWFGLAAIALIPLQAWLIPRLQRQINLMNKERIKEIRNLAAMIGESAAGASEIRVHGGWRYRLATVTEQLGVVYRIRFEIFKKKFFMKFINNLITQLTPFFFFSIGGYLVINGAVSLGALVAALAAYKDLSSPWKELLTFYNQSQDMSLRWDTVVEKFSPQGVLEADLMEDAPDPLPRLNGPIVLEDVAVLDADGNTVLENISGTFPPGALVGIAAASEEDRSALSDVLTREVLPANGRVTIAGMNILSLHQNVISARIGHASSNPVLFRGSFGDNVMMALQTRPNAAASADEEDRAREAVAAGNSADRPGGSWLHPDMAGIETEEDLRAWWLTLVAAMGSEGPLFRKALDQVVQENHDADMLDKLVALRPKVWSAIVKAGLERHVYRFDPNLYNPALSVAGNLLFASMRRPMRQEELLVQTDLFEVLDALGLEDALVDLSRDVIDVLNQIFGTDGTEHPLFRKLGLDPKLYEQSVQIVQTLRARPDVDPSEAQKRILVTVPALISAEQIGPAFPDEMKARILALRSDETLEMRDELRAVYEPLDPEYIALGLSVLENVLFGKMSESAGGRADDIRKIVSEVLDAEGVKPGVMKLIFDLDLSLNGANLPAVFAEPLALSRAAIKRPDILVLHQTLASYDLSVRVAMHKNLRALMPEATLIYLSDAFEDPDRFDVYMEIVQGRMVTDDPRTESETESAASADLMRKVRALEATDLFSGLSRKQLRLLAFGAKWFSASKDEVIFRKMDDPTDGAYMVLSGEAGLYNPRPDGQEDLIAEVGAGRLVGELGLIRNVPRALTFRAHTEFHALRLGAEEFLAVVENDAATSFKLLQVVAGYTS
jgi:ABC-type multidrug transport system fused ATPase/permease subunit